MLQSSAELVAVTLQNFRAQCAIPALAAELVSTLEPLGWRVDDDVHLELIIDGP